MNDISIGTDFLSSLAGSGAVAVFVARWTLLLALAWLAHAALGGRNPRWRVALWRGAIVGVGLVAAMATCAPIVNIPIVPAPMQALAEGREEVVARPRLEAATPPVTVVPVAALLTMERPEAGAPPARSIDGHEPAAVPGPTVSWPSRALGLAGSWAMSLWLCGMLVLTGRLILASLALDRLVRRSADAPEEIARECRAIAGDLGWTRALRVVRSPEVATPCLAGIVRPVLLLPDREGQDDLPAILAHELAHARHHDLAWNLAAHLASIALWFHPLAWRIRSAHAAACDAVSDAVAAGYLGDVVSYGRTLARLAVRAARPAPANVLAMARTSDVRRRLDALNRRVFRTPLPWRLIMPALLVGGVLLVLIGGFGFIRAEQAADPAGQAADPPRQQSSGKMTLRAVAAATNQPVEGASIEYYSRFDGKYQEGKVATGKDGLATIDYPPNSRIESFWVIARKARLVPVAIVWTDQSHPVELPKLKELRFVPGTTIGGIVQDEAGHPIAGATVNVVGSPTETESAHHGFSLATIETDAQGRWRMDEAPSSLSDIAFNVQHPRYRRNGANAYRNLDGVIVLTKGLTLTGRVVDAAGRPIKGARAMFGPDRFATDPPPGTTDDRGEFTLENCDPGPSIVTVQAEGYAPQFRDVRAEAGAAPVVITLPEPGATLRVKVVDVEGKPVGGAIFAVDTWRGHRSLDIRKEAGADGRIEWRSAPRDVMLCDVFKQGYMSSRELALTASDREHVVTLYPELVISGRVIDAETGRPLPNFRLIRGGKYKPGKETHWHENEAVVLAGGRYTTRFSQPCVAFFVRVDAPGYQPAESRAFRLTDKSQTFDFALRRGGGLSAVVLRPDGQPAAGAEVVLATERNGWLMEAGRFDRMANLPRFTAGPDGRFTFTPPSGEFLIIAACDAGYADTTRDELAKSGKLVLLPWGKIEGEVRIGKRPGVQQHVSYRPDFLHRGGRSYNLTYGYNTTTDELGRFTFDRVVPRAGWVSREVANPANRPGIPAWGWETPVEVKPGQTARVRIGGQGRAVTGRVVLDGQPETPVDWTRNQAAVIHDQRNHLRFAADLDKDGGFRIEDVPPGLYVLRLPVDGPADPQTHGDGDPIGLAMMDLIVPDPPASRPDQPFALGTITAKIFPTLKIGESAPDFDVERLAGKGQGDRLKLGDERGKVVLIHFWMPGHDPSLEPTLALKEIQKSFGGDPRFRLISLSFAMDAESSRRVIRENGLIWTHGFAGTPDHRSGLAISYKLRSSPSTFLIGPDGRILAKDLKDAALKEAIASALESADEGKEKRK